MSTQDFDHRSPEEDPMSTSTTQVPETPTPVDAPTAVGTTPSEPVHSGPRITTIVWGLVIAAVGAGLLAVALGVAFDLELAVIILIAGAGVALVLGSIVRSRR